METVCDDTTTNCDQAKQEQADELLTSSVLVLHSAPTKTVTAHLSSVIYKHRLHQSLGTSGTGSLAQFHMNWYSLQQCCQAWKWSHEHYKCIRLVDPSNPYLKPMPHIIEWALYPLHSSVQNSINLFILMQRTGFIWLSTVTTVQYRHWI